MLSKIRDAMVEFFGSLFGIEAVLDRPRRDYSKRTPRVEDLSSRY